MTIFLRQRTLYSPNSNLRAMSTSAPVSLNKRRPIAINGSQFQLREVNAGNGVAPDTLLLMFGFYNPSEEAIDKYCNIYHELGFNVLFIPSRLKHFAWPKNSLQLTNSLLKYLDSDCQHYRNILVHAFSMGAYNFTVFYATLGSMPDRYSGIGHQIRGVVYDSLVMGTLQHMTRGIGSGISKNSLTRAVIPLLMNTYFCVTRPATVDFFDKYITVFKQRPLEVPTLIFYCKNDPLSDWKSINDTTDQWMKMTSFPVTTKCWDTSKHAAHLRVHSDDYLKTLNTFLLSIPSVTISGGTKSRL